jgi:type II secretory pathway component PulF
MPDYKYQAINETGRVSKGTIVAFNDTDVEVRLRAKSLTLIKSKPVKRKRFTTSIFGGKIKARLLIEFYQRFSQSLRVGLPILATLDENIKMISSRMLRKIIEEVKVSVEDGNFLYQAMGQFPRIFHKLDLSIVMMGEESGTLPESLKHMADFLEWKEDLKSTIKRATVYPSFVLVAVMAVIGVWVGYVLPQMASVLAEMGVDLPSITRAVFGTSLFVQAQWPYLLGVMFAIVASLYLFQRSSKGKEITHRYILKAPLIGVVLSNIAIARLSHYFSVMLKSGMQIDKIFEILSEGILGNRYLERQLNVAYGEVLRGQTLSEGFERAKGFPLLLLGGIRNGEVSGTLEESFNRLGEYYDSAVKSTVQVMVNAFEPITILLLGGVFGVILLSILLPLYDMISGMGGAY